jgi:hypothetical protein
MGAPQRFGKPVVSVSNIKYISLIPALSSLNQFLQKRGWKGKGVETIKVLTVYLTGFKRFEIVENDKK